MKKWLAMAGLLPLCVYADQPSDKTRLELRDDSQVICEYESTTRGELDGSAFRYCLKTHRRALAKAEDLESEYGDRRFFAEIASPHCYQDNTRRGVSNIRGIASCLEYEIEGFKDVEYYAQHLDRDSVIRLANMAIERYGSWNMAQYIVRKELDPPP